MKRFKSDIIFLTILFIVTVFNFNSCLNKVEIYNKTYSVTGTIYGMSCEAVSRYKSTKVYTEYRIAVHPDDKKLFHDFDTEVSFSTYCKYNVGDRITFSKMCGSTVLNKQEVTSGERAWWLFSSTICVLSFLSGLIIFLINFLGCRKYDY